MQGLSRGAAPGGGWYPRRPQGLSILVSSSNGIAHKAQDPAGTGRHGVSVTARVLSRNARVPSGGRWCSRQMRDGEECRLRRLLASLTRLARSHFDSILIPVFGGSERSKMMLSCPFFQCSRTSATTHFLGAWPHVVPRFAYWPLLLGVFLESVTGLRISRPHGSRSLGPTPLLPMGKRDTFCQYPLFLSSLLLLLPSLA